MNNQPSPEFEKEIRETLGAPNANPAFVRDLRETLLERSKMKKQNRSFSRLAWGFAMAVTLIGLLIASPRTAEAMKRLWGYIPGVGYVEPGNSLRVLSAPVTVEKDGLMITIEKGAADTQRTILLERIEGFMPEPSSDHICMNNTRLVLSDGTVLDLMDYESVLEGGKGDPGGLYHGRYVFETLPAQTLDATLEIQCLMGVPTDNNFNIQLHFQIADEEQVMPVIALPTESIMESETSVDTAPQTDPTTDSVSSAGAPLEGFSIVFESETPLADGYILSGSYQWTDTRFDVYSIFPRDQKITDANGQPVVFEIVEAAAPLDPAVKKLPFAYQITGKDHAWPLTVTLQSIVLTLPDQGTFRFDAGANPQVGQEWDVNIDVPVGEYSIHVQAIELIEGRTPTQLGFAFTLVSSHPVMSATVADLNPIIIESSNSGGGGGGGGGGGSSETPFMNSWVFEGYSPVGLKTFVISDLTVLFNGTWQTVWSPSAQ